MINLEGGSKEQLVGMKKMKKEDNKSSKESLDGSAEAAHENSEKVRKEGVKKRAKKPGYIGAIIVNLILLYVANNLLNWHVPFLTNSFIAALGLSIYLFWLR